MLRVMRGRAGGGPALARDNQTGEHTSSIDSCTDTGPVATMSWIAFRATLEPSQC